MAIFLFAQLLNCNRIHCLRTVAESKVENEEMCCCNNLIAAKILIKHYRVALDNGTMLLCHNITSVDDVLY